MTEFIHTITNIFSTDPAVGCLGINHQHAYYIAPYQRGYKWDSGTPDDQVPQLLIDLYEAHTKKAKEYYLQYITVKPDNEVAGQKCFEVIDGQQRLTTLSLLFHCLGEKDLDKNIALGKVLYARYNNDIFSEVVQHVEDDSTKDKDIPTQDLYYMVRAYRCIQKFFQLFTDEEDKRNFLHYILNHVKIIVNKESTHVSSEDIFTNLNDNKVELTNPDLIKGLLLTKASRKLGVSGKPLHFREIIDLRNIMGRTWDEINAWFNNKKVKHYFFRAKKEEDGMIHMLALVNTDRNQQTDIHHTDIIQRFKNQLLGTEQKSQSKFKEFNRFNEYVHTPEDAENILNQIKHIYRKFRNIYENHDDCQLYNLLGYMLFYTDKPGYELKKLISQSDETLADNLRTEAVKLLPKDVTVLKYNNRQDQQIRQWLLALSVFPESKNPQYRFDFYAYDHQKWTLEHISPQNPDKEIKIDPVVKKWICDEIRKHVAPNEQENIIEEIEQKNSIDSKKIDWIYETVVDINHIGNMALLSGGVNSALSNNPFPIKRRILLDKFNQDYFVPRHTVDVFSKILSAQNGKYFNPDLVKWDETDAQAHAAWMESRCQTLKKELTPTQQQS